jgi:hypothetical protein
MVYDAQPPYVVQQTKDLNAELIQSFARMAKYWDLVVNSGRFKKTIALISSTQRTSGVCFLVVHAIFQLALAKYGQNLWANTRGLGRCCV